MMRLAAVLLMLRLLGVGCASAAAGPDARLDSVPGRSVDYAFWSVEGAAVRLRVLMPWPERDRLARPGAATPRMTEARAAVRAGFAVSAGGHDCPPVSQGEKAGDVDVLAPQPGTDRFEMTFACRPGEGRLVLHDHLMFDRATGHLDYARIRMGDRDALAVFTASRQDLALPSGAGPIAHTGVLAFVAEGMRRRLVSAEGVGMIAGLVLLPADRRGFVTLSGGLLAGYLLSLPMIASGLFEPMGWLVSVICAALILLLGATVLALRSVETGEGRRRTGLALVGLGVLAAAVSAVKAGGQAALPAAGLGLACAALSLGAGAGMPGGPPLLGLAAMAGVLEGLMPAEDLRPLELPNARLLPLIAGQDVGDAIASVALGAAMLAGAWLLARRLAGLRALLEDVAGAGLLGLGTFLYAGRILG